MRGTARFPTSGNRAWRTVGTRCSRCARARGFCSKNVTTRTSARCSRTPAAKPCKHRKGSIVGTNAQPFLSDIKELRRRARENIERGPVTDGYQLDVKQVCDILNQALATEIVCVLRYKRHYFMATGLN